MAVLTDEQKEMIREVIANNHNMFWCRQKSIQIALPEAEKESMYQQIVFLIEALNDPLETANTRSQQKSKEELIFLIIATELFYYSQFMIAHSPSPDHFMIAILTQAISNSIMAIRQLIESGYDYQAMVLMRNVYELYSTLIVTVVDSEKRKEYRTAEDRDAARSAWYRHFRSEKFKKTLKKYLKKFPDLSEEILELAELQYDILCAFAHNDYISILQHTFSAQVDNGLLSPNIWGRFTGKKAYLYKELFLTAGIFNMLFFEILMDESVDINIVRLHKLDDGTNQYDSDQWMLFVAIDSLHRLELSLSELMFTLCQEKTQVDSGSEMEHG